MKKILVLASSALAVGGLLVSATPAFAGPVVAPIVTLSSNAIENGGALEISFSQAFVPPGFCVVAELVGYVDANSPAESTMTTVILEGTNTILNANLTSDVITNSVSVYSVAVDCDSPRTLVSVASWTVNPLLTVAAPADFIVGTPATQTVVSTLNDFSENAYVDLTTGAHWEVAPGDLCESALGVSSIDLPAYVALPAGITIDSAVSAAGTVPALTFSGTAAADEVGSYQLCLKLIGENRPETTAYASTTLTVVPAVVPAVVVPVLAATGADTTGLLAGGAGVLGLGVLLLAALRRRNASV